MKHPIRLLMVALLAALAPMLMAPTGGYPSQPTFQKVTVKSAAILAANVTCAVDGVCVSVQRTSGTNQPKITYTFTDSSGKSTIDFNGSAGSPNGSISVNGSDVATFTAGNANLIAGSTIGATAVCLSSGTNCPTVTLPKLASGVVTITGAACTVNSHTGSFPSTCGLGATGDYTFTLSPGYTSSTSYACVANGADSSVTIFDSLYSSGSAYNLLTFTAAHAAAYAVGGHVSIVCYGT